MQNLQESQQNLNKTYKVTETFNFRDTLSDSNQIPKSISKRQPPLSIPHHPWNRRTLPTVGEKPRDRSPIGKQTTRGRGESRVGGSRRLNETGWTKVKARGHSKVPRRDREQSRILTRCNHGSRKGADRTGTRFCPRAVDRDGEIITETPRR